ncbi:hypothetical protein JCM8547_003740 [Rhodosporidiobolus lusitaniae]
MKKRRSNLMSAFLSRALSSSRPSSSGTRSFLTFTPTSGPQPSTLDQLEHPLPVDPNDNTPVLQRPPSPKTAEREARMDRDQELAWLWSLW